MENIYHVWTLITLAIILAAFIGYKLAQRSNRKLQRCVHFTASTPTGRLITGKYYFKGNNVPEHEIKAVIQDQLNMRRWIIEHITLVHIASFKWNPKSSWFVIDSWPFFNPKR